MLPLLANLGGLDFVGDCVTLVLTMKNALSSNGIIIVGVVILIFGIWCSCLQNQDDIRRINAWAKGHQETVDTIDQKLFNNGPYFFSKNCRIYEVITKEGNDYWFRYGFMADNIYKLNTNGEYTKIQ